MKVLIATDGSEFSQAAIEKCCRMFGESENTALRIISVAELAMAVGAEPFAVSDEFIQQMIAAARKQAVERIATAENQIRSRFPALAAELTNSVATGSPEQAIVEEAEKWGADLIKPVA